MADMKRWRVETRVTGIRVYYVDGENEKEAEAASVGADAEYAEDENEETMSIIEVPRELDAVTAGQ